MNNWILAEYRRLRELGWPAKDALSTAKIKDEFQDLEAQWLVKFEVVPDELCEIDDLIGDAEGELKKEILDQIDLHF